MPKPVIAAVNGPAVGIGCSLALACDLIVAAESAYFLLAFVNIGLVPDGGSTAFIPARVGYARAAEMAMLGERVPARAGARLGPDQPGRPRRGARVRRPTRCFSCSPRGPTTSYAGVEAAAQPQDVRRISPDSSTPRPRPSASRGRARTSSRAFWPSSRSARRTSPAGSSRTYATREMFFRQILHEDLSCASYLVGDTDAGVAAVVDPAMGDRALPATQPPARRADRARARDPQPRRPRLRARPRSRGRPGRPSTSTSWRTPNTRTSPSPTAGGWPSAKRQVEALHTPGHRPEHTSFLLRDADRGGEPWAVLTGDSLFVGDVARPDLAIEPREGAAGIFRSLHERLMALPDDVEVWPGHLGGSACGSAGHRPQVDLDDRLRARVTTGPCGSRPRRSSSRTRSRPSASRRPTSSTSSRSTGGR